MISIRPILLLLHLTSFHLTLFSQPEFEKSTCELINTFPETWLNNSQAKISLVFHWIGKPRKGCVTILVNNDSIDIKTDSLGQAFLILEIGKYSLTFTSEYVEPVNVNEIEFKPRTKTIFLINFEPKVNAMPQILYQYDKPVIYFYPQKTTQINAQLEFDGELGFCYPSYNSACPNDNVGRGWNFIADSSGNLNFNGKTFNYIFWEGESKTPFRNADYTRGLIINTDTLVSFFENSLTQIGLISPEIQDFITYWVPRMNKNKLNYIHFLFNDEYSKFAKLNVWPIPDNQLRMFMLWSKTEIETETIITQQELPSFSRKGFHIVEWGGSEISLPNF